MSGVCALAVLVLLTPPSLADSAMAGSGRRTLIAQDDFRSGTGKWTAELLAGGTVTASNGRLDIDVPDGATVWFKQPFSGSYEIEYTAVPVSAGGPNDRVSDLNTFWSARDIRSPRDLFATERTGAFTDYDYLKGYYAGLGGNTNTTTRFRRYVGEPGNRPLIYDLTSPLLEPNRPYHIRQTVHGNKIQYRVNGTLLFDYTDPSPYRSGWFAFRTIDSHFTITDFKVWRPATGKA
ncbi:DUF6250 domain-containing protein [Saccharothrix sp. ALI-22-I]|uniref:DUF6250 domain-containing protein n=1 Tax=Saccharothrix sp. ALI-22-I TaxID=1933778 RepID=UPI00117A128A|nr:DUF6250 domain-containing protein [Saccharothrix sp. ALI-22-I]